jgi:hypothetical protein
VKGSFFLSSCRLSISLRFTSCRLLCPKLTDAPYSGPGACPLPFPKWRLHSQGPHTLPSQGATHLLCIYFSLLLLIFLFLSSFFLLLSPFSFSFPLFPFLFSPFFPFFSSPFHFFPLKRHRLIFPPFRGGGGGVFPIYRRLEGHRPRNKR